MRKSANLPLHHSLFFCHAPANHRQKMSAEQFHPEKLLAAGPAAKVYRGVEVATGRKVLLKSLLNEHETPHALDREQLQLLAPSLMQIRHPQIAGLITLVPTEDEFALIYDFMPGMNVRVFAAERQTTPTDLRALAVQLMHALIVGEQLRQPHGDPKPSNLIVADHPGGGLFVQVQDWGLTQARAVQSPETLWFRAPELHACGQPTSQSDLFTAAGSLFCLATNSAPAQGDDPADLVQQWQAFDAGATLRHMRPDLDQPLIDWIAWLLRPDPALRPHSVAQALEALMPTMQTGFIYMPQQAPQMPPGTQTTPLGAAAHPNAPRPKPITPKSAPDAAKSSGAQPSKPPAKSSSGSRTAIAVVLNLIAIVLVGFFAWPFVREGVSGWSISTDEGNSVSTEGTGAKKSAPEATAGPGLKGRYVRIEIPGKAVLNLAEVQVFSGDANIALQGNATQSSVDWGGKPEFAIDGNTDGDNSKGGKVSHTDGKARRSPWWQVDLGREAPLQSIIIWNRTDKDFGERTKNLTVKVLDAQQKVVWEKKGLPKPDPRLKIEVGG
jgi:serine/threonine protein kinase